MQRKASYSAHHLMLALVLILGGCETKSPADREDSHVTDMSSGQINLTNPSYFSMPVEGQCCLVIAHAGGAIDGNSYTNSVDALEANYALGTRFFELDFQETADGHWVSTHDWDNWKRATKYTGAVPPDLATFSELPLIYKGKGWSIGGRYSTISLQWLNEFLLEHKDAIIVTDIKELDMFDDFVSEILSMPTHSQFIFQAYSIKNVDSIKKKDPSARIILTMYRSGRPSGANQAIAVRRHQIEGITLPVTWANDPVILNILKAVNVPLYLHGAPSSINSRGLQAYFSDKGVNGFYLD